MLKQYAPSLKHIAEIIEKGIKEHPGTFVYYVPHALMYLYELYCSYSKSYLSHSFYILGQVRTYC